ncbi:hypothetical protein TorRG33x02_113960 [Trema orientale]|uniref:Uncharacterized protein n=1 Tax=Trema orientale TaxID=63057 RepID=A0A2P5F4S3_TREOI|nr:hypothetical protein TorRG33x02_113960 [Trema orientale]
MQAGPLELVAKVEASGSSDVGLVSGL